MDDKLNRYFDELSAEEQYQWIIQYFRTLKDKKKGLTLAILLLNFLSNISLKNLLFEE